ncbi:hypothetical protein D3C87_1711390 [compost metagenome]
MGAAEIVAAGADLADRVHGLAFLGEIDAHRHLLHHAELVLVDHELLVGRDQTAFQPTGRMQHEVGAGKQCHVQRVGRFVRCLSVRHL